MTEEVRQAEAAKSSDVEIRDPRKGFGRGQTFPKRPKIRSDGSEKNKIAACMLFFNFYVLAAVNCTRN